MLRRMVLVIGAVAAAIAALVLPAARGAQQALPDVLAVDELRLSPDRAAALQQRFFDQIEARHRPGEWAPLRMELDDAELALMGLPPKQVLLGQRSSKPTTYDRDGKAQPAANSGTAVVAGAGWFGIRPGGLLLSISGNSIGWCSFAHVYGTPGSYSISTAGHCGKVGDTATVVGVIGNRNVPVLMDIGTFSKSTDGGLGNDWALISVRPEYQHLVTPTMAFWGGPIGMYTKTGDVASVTFPGRGLVPTVSATPDPMLAQQIVHYGHGTAVGTGGTPRSATAIAWRPDHFMFFGAISPGDSGSGSNTLTGDTVGANREAAGINTHLYVDPLMRQGLGIMGGTRATKVPATLANGQLVPYPAPTPVPLP